MHRFGCGAVFKRMHAIKRYITSCTLLQFPLRFLCKGKYREKKEKCSVTKIAPWHCFQVQKMRVSKNETPEISEIIREAPLQELRQDNRFHPLHIPGEVSAALGNETEQFGRSPGHGVSGKPRTHQGCGRISPSPRHTMPVPWEACTHTGETLSAISHGCATNKRSYLLIAITTLKNARD